MTFKRLFLTTAFTAAAACAQDVAIYPPILPRDFEALRAHLSLSQTQVDTLRAVQRDRQNAEQQIHKDIRDKHLQLETLLRDQSQDYARIGQLTVEIRTLQRKLPVSGEPYRSRALGVLTQEQRPKLAALSTALQLQPAAWEAVNLSLIDRPERGGDVIIQAVPPVRTLPAVAQ
ncbi:MAG: periplasmic heavy metal sensor [Bryobacteraceae bacterium]